MARTAQLPSGTKPIHAPKRGARTKLMGPLPPLCSPPESRPWQGDSVGRCKFVNCSAPRRKGGASVPPCCFKTFCNSASKNKGYARQFFYLVIASPSLWKSLPRNGKEHAADSPLTNNTGGIEDETDAQSARVCQSQPRKSERRYDKAATCSM